MDYDFIVEYKPGRLNTMADALSRRDWFEGSLVCTLTAPRLALFGDLRVAIVTNAGQVAL